MFRRFSDFFRNIPGNLGLILSNFPGVRAITCICVAVYLLQGIGSFFAVRLGSFSAPLDALLSAVFGIYWPWFSSGCIWQPVIKRLEKDAAKYILLEYNPQSPSDLGNIDILKTQRRGEIRYMPFVTTIESITKE